MLDGDYSDSSDDLSLSPPEEDDEQARPADGAVHAFFGLSYVNYLVLHRSLLQSMPADWQRKFCRLVERLNDRFAGMDQPAGGYDIHARDRDGRYIEDPIPHYNRGRAFVPATPQGRDEDEETTNHNDEGTDDHGTGDDV